MEGVADPVNVPRIEALFGKYAPRVPEVLSLKGKARLKFLNSLGIEGWKLYWGFKTFTLRVRCKKSQKALQTHGLRHTWRTILRGVGC